MNQTPAPLPAPNRQAPLYVFLGVLAIAVVVTLRMISPYLMALAMGGVLAMMAMPLQRRLTTRGFKPSSAAAVVTIFVILVVVGPLTTFVSLAAKQAINIGTQFAQSDFSMADLIARIAQFAPVAEFIGDEASITQHVRDYGETVGRAASGFIVNLAKSVPEILMQLALACIACYFFLVDGRTFVAWAYSKIPLETDIRNRLAGAFKDTAISVVWASMAAAGAQALCMLVAFAALRVPGAFFAAGATFIFAWIPILGSGPVWILGAVYLVTQGATAKAIVMVVAGVLTGITDNFVRPWVLKGRGEMHPLVALVAIFGGIQMFGLLGVLFGPIMAAIVITLLQIWPLVGRRLGLELSGIEPPPGSTPG